jgi:hypothetical protein
MKNTTPEVIKKKLSRRIQCGLIGHDQDLSLLNIVVAPDSASTPPKPDALIVCQRVVLPK